jgi:hypothetical protein
MKKEVEKKEWVDVKLEIPKIMNLLFHKYGKKLTKKQRTEQLIKIILGENFI